MRLALLLCVAALCLADAAGAATYYVSVSGNDNAPGSASQPWRTIQHGVSTLKPGDTLLIGPGIYREAIKMERGGTPSAPITISAVPGARVVVTGADLLTGWVKAPGNDPIYVHDWPYVFPIDRRPDGTLQLTHPGDKEHELTGRAEQVIHDDRLLRQVLRRDQMAHGTFYVDIGAKKLYVWLRGSDDPNGCEMEGCTRSTWLVAGPKASYVHLRGIRFRYAANHAQRGAFALNGCRGWVVEECVFERANAAGASLSGEGHLFRRCVFQDNGQIGFGTSGCHNTVMVQCGVYRNNTKGYSEGWEAGGLKVTMSRGFAFDQCRVVDNRGCGIWYDIGNEKGEVRNCYIADNDGAGIFYEISYGLRAHDNLIVNNANRGERVGGAWGMGGITLSSSEDCVVEHNTLVGNRDGIAFREQDRSTPRIDAPSKSVRILNKNHVIRDNIVAYSQAYNVALWMDTNFFGPHPSGEDTNRPTFEDPATLSVQFGGNVLWPLPGRPSYLYGVPWRPKSKTCGTPAEFTAASHIPDTSRVEDPGFVDALAGDYRLKPGSAARRSGAGVRYPDKLPATSW